MHRPAPGASSPSGGEAAGAWGATVTPAAPTWTDADGLHIDVRGLPPPQPLVDILRLLSSVPAGGAVIAHLARDPLLLYPELAQIGWQAERLPAAGGEVCLRLTAAP
ncbi:MAG: DUF2249 domain-containing protein [Rubrivivax sp.]|nr:DUF2249 domain-containing protein [Rubrivivax sp.]